MFNQGKFIKAGKIVKKATRAFNDSIVKIQEANEILKRDIEQDELKISKTIQEIQKKEIEIDEATNSIQAKNLEIKKNEELIKQFESFITG